MSDQPNFEEFAGAGSQQKKDATEVYDGRYGKYKDAVSDDTNQEGKLPNLPKGADPKPFTIKGG